MEEDARLFIQIRNFIDSKVLGLVNNCEFGLFGVCVFWKGECFLYI